MNEVVIKKITFVDLKMLKNVYDQSASLTYDRGKVELH